MAGALPGCTVRDGWPAPESADLLRVEDVSDTIGRGLDEQRALGREIGVDWSGLRAVLALVDGVPVVERYQDCTAEDAHDVQAATAAVMCALVGIAIAEGRLSLDDTLASLLPERARTMSPAAAATTLRQLLTMDASFDERLVGPRPRFEQGRDWIAELLSWIGAGRPSGGYAGYAVHLLSAVLDAATGLPVPEYARTRLFDPLGIGPSPAGPSWPLDPEGHAIGYRGLRLRPRDLAAIGRLHLDGGLFRGRRVLPAAWVREATGDQLEAGPRQPWPTVGHGYLWRIRSVRGERGYAVLGTAGQVLEVVPALGLVVVVAVEQDPTDATDLGIHPSVTAALAESVIAPAVAGLRRGCAQGC